MLKLIKRCPEYVAGYREYCQEMYDNHVTYHVCESLGGIWEDTIDAYNDAEGRHLLRRYWISL